MVGGLSVPVAPQEVPKATETTSQSEYLAPPQLLLTCFHPLVTPRANTKHRIILFYLPFRQPKWLRLNLPHDPHGQSGDMYTPSLLEHLRLKWDEETDKGLATEKMAGFSFQPAVLKKRACAYIDLINSASWIQVYLSSRLHCYQRSSFRYSVAGIVCKLLSGQRWDDLQRLAQLPSCCQLISRLCVWNSLYWKSFWCQQKSALKATLCKKSMNHLIK